MHRVLRALWYAVVSVTGQASMAASLAIVTDLRGEAAIEGSTKPRTLSILSEIDPGCGLSSTWGRAIRWASYRKRDLAA